MKWWLKITGQDSNCCKVPQSTDICRWQTTTLKSSNNKTLQDSSLEQVAAVLTATGRTTAATYRITLANARYSLHFTMGWKLPPNLQFSPGDLGPHLKHGSFGPTKSISPMASELVHLFYHSSCLRPTYRDSDTAHVTSVTIGSIPTRYACNVA